MAKLTSCGDDCDHCPRYFFNINNDIEKAKEVAELWFRCGWRDRIVGPDEIVCKGCFPENWCRYGISRCTAEKGIPNCGECDAYPCERIEEAFQRAAMQTDHLKKICTKEEYEVLEKAFFFKKQYLDQVNRKCKISVK
ncbi:MAG: DUF3795 domain-containing protein [Chitinophagales bacterium]